MDERWRRVKALFQAAAEQPADGRDAFLGAAPGIDDDLRRDVRSLLRADATDSLFDRLPLAGAAVLAAIPPRPVLADGIQIGPYVIDRLIGSGSIGEVYRARDTRLNRDVALKILPADLAGDLDRLARFRREAQVLATLNHPNIAGIYGLEETGRLHGTRARVHRRADTRGADCGQASSTSGKHWASRSQIADALDAAHEGASSIAI